MTRFQKLAAATVATALLLVTIGVIVRATGSGWAAPTGRSATARSSRRSTTPKAWIEWIHRTVAVDHRVRGHRAGRRSPSVDHRDRPILLWPSIGAVALVGFQAWLGKETVRLGNSGESVTAHLAAAMALVGLLVFILVRSLYPARIGGRGASQRFTLVAAFGAVAVFALLLFGSHVTATDASGSSFPDWPLMNGSLFPPLTDATSAQVLHRWVAVVVGLIVAAVGSSPWRTQRDNQPVAPPRARRGGPVPDPGGRRRPPDPDRPLGLDAVAPRRAGRAHLGDARRARVRELLRRPGRGRAGAAGSSGSAEAGGDGARRPRRGPRTAQATRCAPTSR